MLVCTSSLTMDEEILHSRRCSSASASTCLRGGSAHAGASFLVAAGFGIAQFGLNEAPGALIYTMTLPADDADRVPKMRAGR